MHPNPSHTYWALPSNKEVPTVPRTEMVQTKIPLCDSPHHLLIVDDIPAIRLLLREGLEDYGYQCETAQHGLEALQQLHARHYDIVLTDLQMPFLDGMELAKYIHQDPNLGNPMVIMMTASEIDLLEDLASVWGIKKILSKPCLPCEIHQVILDGYSRVPHAA